MSTSPAPGYSYSYSSLGADEESQQPEPESYPKSRIFCLIYWCVFALGISGLSQIACNGMLWDHHTNNRLFIGGIIIGAIYVLFGLTALLTELAIGKSVKSVGIICTAVCISLLLLVSAYSFQIANLKVEYAKKSAMWISNLVFLLVDAVLTIVTIVLGLN